MCLAIPMQLVECDRLQGTAEFEGVRRKVGLMLCPEARTGDYVLVHAGYAIGMVDEDEAKSTLELLKVILREEAWQ